MLNGKRKKGNKDYTDCSQISVGMTIPNYRALCMALGEKIKTGESKKSQIRRWDRYFKYEKNKNAFTILEIYETPLPDSDKRKEKFGLYSGYIRFLLLKYVLQTKDNCVFLPKYRWWELLGMTNENYKQYLPYKDRDLFNGELTVAETEKTRFSSLERIISDKYNVPIDSEDVSFFYELSQKKLREILNNAIASLKNRRLIKCDEIFVIRMANGSSEIVGSNDKKLISEIVNLQNQALRNIGFERYSDVIAAGQTFRYYKTLQLLTESTHTIKNHPEKSWRNIYEYTQIVFSQNKEELERQLFQTAEELIQNDTLESEYKKALNDNVVIALNDIIKDEHVTYWGEPNPMNFINDDDDDNIALAEALYHNEKFKNKVKAKDNFLQIQNSLVDYLIDIDS